MSRPVRTGLDLLSRAWPKQLRDSRVGLVVHPASVNRNLRHAADIFSDSGTFRLAALFGPQHGIRGETQDNMIEWEGFRDSRTGLPVHSLYGKTRKPLPAMLKPLDAVVVDLQDVGARYYTFIWTMLLIMEACAEQGKVVVVLDRPNPVSGQSVEGPMLHPDFASFVGLKPLPARHGMTIGEIALYLRDRYVNNVRLHVIPMKAWSRKMWFDSTGLPWVLPSPNMPTLETATVYPGMCLLEGTTLSEGRGTTRPFEIFGAPFIDPFRLTQVLDSYRLPGVAFRPFHFLPTFQKHAGRLCGGAQIHLLNRERFLPFRTAVAILKAVRDLWPDEQLWKRPPYEYETRKMPIDILSGSERLRKEIDAGTPLPRMAAWWQEETTHFDRTARRNYLIYK